MDLKVYVLNVFGEDIHDVFVFDSYEKAVNQIRTTLKDHYHFDTDTPYLTEQKMKDVITEMEYIIYEDGEYENEDDLRFTIDERYVD
jgi:hypothetical protein